MATDEIDTHPAVVAARTLADDLLAPAAAEVDRTTVPRSHLDALAAAGLLGVSAPVAVGGLGAPPAVVRRTQELIAGADLSTWFVQIQHHTCAPMALDAGREDLARDLATGRAVAGIAFSHLRRRPARPVVAVPDGAGWRLVGDAPWYTGWGINDVALLGGATDDGRVVFGVVPAREQPGLAASAPMDVAALRSAVTVTLRLDGLRLGPDDVLLVDDIEAWARRDARPSANPVPAVFGVAESALDLLAARGRGRDEPEAVDAAERLRSRVLAVKGEVYHLLDEVDPDAQTQRRLRLRALAQALMVECTTALVVAGAGASMAASDPAQRKAREALFLLVQAQTRPARSAALGAFAR
ncbi:acyl-CoA dehydrogenase family protein [Kineosporia sp. A_224]|uniref:acyl-CoA dehydrogenase family protein n=1 Tax=Kineosporia sp. A_224 TaxID=1962180 RepID=UPI0018E9B7D2|nr:acyl-CoA dehydrogenase family protein [Kineosporia sp. A_224]